MGAQGKTRPFLARLQMVLLDPAGADEEQIADFYVAALGCWADVYALVLSAVVQLFEGDGIVVFFLWLIVWLGCRGKIKRTKRIVLNPFCFRIASIVEKDTPARNAMLGPVVDGAFLVGSWP